MLHGSTLTHPPSQPHASSAEALSAEEQGGCGEQMKLYRGQLQDRAEMDGRVEQYVWVDLPTAMFTKLLDGTLLLLTGVSACTYTGSNGGRSHLCKTPKGLVQRLARSAWHLPCDSCESRTGVQLLHLWLAAASSIMQTHVQLPSSMGRVPFAWCTNTSTAAARWSTHPICFRR